MDSMYSFFFAAGVAGFAYTKMGSRLGYGNGKSVWMFVGLSFILSFIFFYTFITYVVHLS
jgi:hypothetical protein